MAYTALYRKYRPSNFANVVGQDVVVDILKNSIINNKISHAYLFTGRNLAISSSFDNL